MPKDDKELDDFFKKEDKKVISHKEEKPAEKPKQSEKKRTGVVKFINEKRIVVDVHGNGERIKFDPSKHAQIKVGDLIDL